MKKRNMIFFVSLLSLFLTVPVYSAEVEITFSEPEKYTDIKPSGYQNRSKFKGDVFFNIENHFKKMAESLSEKQKLIINVTDIDLAGDTRIGGNNQMRIIKSMYPPRIDFSYKLIDSNGKTLVEEQIKLRDMGFMMNLPVKYKREFLGYEQRMLDNWFKATFLDYLK